MLEFPFVFLRASSNSSYFSKPYFNGEHCLIKNALGTISIVEQPAQDKHDFVLHGRPRAGDLLLCNRTAHGEKRTKGEEAPERLPKLTF